MMKNLAGNQEADKFIRQELERCRIDIVEVPRTNSEVPYTLEGRLAGFEFRRAWYYWVVSGSMPLDLAQKLYDDPVGRSDIRVAGHCGCPPPIEWARWFTPDGREVVAKAREDEWKAYAASSDNMRMRYEELIFSDDLESLGAVATIDCYHIDSEVGLRIFADTVREMSSVMA